MARFSFPIDWKGHEQAAELMTQDAQLVIVESPHKCDPSIAMHLDINKAKAVVDSVSEDRIDFRTFEVDGTDLLESIIRARVSIILSPIEVDGQLIGVGFSLS